MGVEFSRWSCVDKIHCVSGHIVSLRLCNKPSVPGVQGNSTDESGFVNKSLPDLGNVNALFHTAHKHQVDVTVHTHTHTDRQTCWHTSVKCVHRMQIFSAAPEALTPMFKWFIFSFLNTLYILFISHFVFLPLLCILSKACVNSPIGKKNSIRSIRSFNKRWRVYLDDVHSKNIWFNFTNLGFFFRTFISLFHWSRC